MDLLFITPYIPYPPSFGGSTRIYHLMRVLSREHRISLITFDDGSYGFDVEPLAKMLHCFERVPRRVDDKRAQQLRSLLSRSSFQKRFHHHQTMQEAIDRFFREQGADAAVVEFSQMGFYRFPSGVKVVVDEHNVEYDLLRRMAETETRPLRKLYNRFEYRKFRREEIGICREADLVLATSERDAHILSEEAGHPRFAVVPNGVDTDYFTPAGNAPEERSCIFTGATHYLPNEEAVVWFLETILPGIRSGADDCTFYVVGGRPGERITRHRSDRVVVTGFVDDLRDYLRRSQVFVVPLLAGGGTRFKVVEAMAAGLPVVSTRLGAEGIPVIHEKNILLADDPQSFSGEVLRLFEDQDLCRRLVAGGLDLVRAQYDWRVIGERLGGVLTGQNREV